MKIEIADIVIEFEAKYDYISSLVQEYKTTSPADFSVYATDSEIKDAQKRYSESDYAAESIAIYSKIADALPRYDAILMHGAAIADGDSAYLITAPSGVGKTTHVNNWLASFGDSVHVLNGDKPIVRYFDGTPFVCGTPWQGKEGLGVREKKKLGAIVIFRRGEINRAEQVEAQNVSEKLLSQIYIPRGIEEMQAALSLLDRLLSDIPIIVAECNMEKNSAFVVRDAIIKARARYE